MLRGTRVAVRLQRLVSQKSNSTTKECYIERLDGDLTYVSVLTLNRPSAKNALSKSLLADFNAAITELKAQKYVFHIQFQFPHFVSLLSLEIAVLSLQEALSMEYFAPERATMNEAQVGEFVGLLRGTFSRLEEVSVPTIAAIDGVALGGGLEIALCCDLRVASDKALLGLPETKLAIIPGAGGTARLPRIAGASKAKELIFLGKRLNGKQAFDYGLLNEVAVSTEAKDSPQQVAYQRALMLAKDMLQAGPIALKMAKKSINEGFYNGDANLTEALQVEGEAYNGVLRTEDRLEGLRAFKEKRKPMYKGQ
ncbi:hypothetical protein MP228_012143 [Amoeboaphelidium protococcarum]|nr:hypothetical protein MP228_012143 [Amoeboaphelidium protococcarum]